MHGKFPATITRGAHQRWSRVVAPLKRLRSYAFRDCRLILEQDGNVRYLIVTAALQRRALRASMMFLLTGAVVIVGMGALNAWLSQGHTRLVRSHEDIRRALLETYGDAGGQAGELDEEQMVAIASSIRQRNSEIQRFVDRSLATISSENDSLSAALRGSGLTEKAIQTIQLSTPVGGFASEATEESHFAEVDALAKSIAKNHELRDVLSALPDRLPLDVSGVSSKFGLRTHPLTGRPQFHTGVDLLPSGDLSVRPVMSGKVVLAGYGEERGNVVMVRHKSGVESLYAHLASIKVKLGDDVTESTVLGIVGNTGSATTGRHLHFEVSIGGYPVNPLKVIRTAQDVRKIQSQR